MATRVCLLACCCGRAESILSPCPLPKERPRPQHPPLAPSSAPDLMVHRGAVPYPRTLRPLRQLVNVLLPVSEPAEPTPVAVHCQGFRASGTRLCFRRAITAPWLLRALQRRRSSLKEPHNITTQRILCQVVYMRPGETLALPPPRQCQRQDDKIITQPTLCQVGSAICGRTIPRRLPVSKRSPRPFGSPGLTTGSWDPILSILTETRFGAT